MKDGIVISYVTKAVVQGEARVGKTSLKCLLVADKYTKDLSTGCIESPCVAVTCYGQTGKYWEKVDEKKMECAIIIEIQLQAEKISDPNDAKRVDIQNETIPSASIKIKNTQHAIEPADVMNTKQTTDAATHSFIKLNTDNNENDAIIRVKDFLEKCKEHQTDGTQLLERRWLYFIDTGGQIQFQKLLPAFMPFASVLILVVSLAKNLFDPASTIMQLPESKIGEDQCSLSVIEILQQLLSSIASSAQQYRSLIADDPILSKCINPPSNKLTVVPVATYHDEYEKALMNGKELISSKEKKLNDISKIHKSTCQFVRQNERLRLFKVDGSKARKSVAEKLDQELEQIAQVLHDNAYKIEVPLKWYCYGILLHDVAKKGCGVLKLSYCQELGHHLGMSPEESWSANKFLTLLNKVLYFPNSPVDDLVFVKLESLVDIIKDLVIYVCNGRPDLGILSLEAKELVAKGQLSIDILRKASTNYNEISKEFPHFEEKLLDLFEYLLIAAKLPDGNFVMPALLPINNVSNIDLSFDKIPLLLYFEKAIPIGLFCVVIVHLLSHDHWKVSKNEIAFSNYFTLNCHDCLLGQVTLVEQVDHIAIYCHSDQDYIKVRCTVEEAVSVAMNTRRLSEGDKPKRAFYCQCTKERHVAVVTPSVADQEDAIICTIKDERQNSEDFLCWLRPSKYMHNVCSM